MPGPFDDLADHRFELEDMTETERPQERANVEGAITRWPSLRWASATGAAAGTFHP
jgi:hypothetical protein